MLEVVILFALVIAEVHFVDLENIIEGVKD